jgi:hypothetical protein
MDDHGLNGSGWIRHPKVEISLLEAFTINWRQSEMQGQTISPMNAVRKEKTKDGKDERSSHDRKKTWRKSAGKSSLIFSLEEVEPEWWRVKGGEWRVESGEWRVGSGEWRVESGEWGVGSWEWGVGRCSQDMGNTFGSIHG